MARTAAPLASYAVLRTHDIEHARTGVAASLAPHRLTVFGTGFALVHNAAQLPRVSLHYIDYGGEVEVITDGLDFQLTQIPLAGASAVSTGHRTLHASSRTAVVTEAGEATRMHYSAGNPRLMVRIETGLLNERRAAASGAGLVVPQSPGATLDVSSGRGRSWRDLLGVVITDLDRGSGLLDTPLTAATLELAIVDALLAGLSVEGGSAGGIRMPHERQIRRAAQLIEEHCDEPLGTPEIAEAVGMSARELQAGFRAVLQTTPMAHLRQARLMRVHQDLRDGRATSVTDAALRWGVTHLGRLSGDFRAAFGETPSETLRRAR